MLVAVATGYRPFGPLRRLTLCSFPPDSGVGTAGATYRALALFGLPAAGVLIVWLYQKWGNEANSGMAGLQTCIESDQARPPVARRDYPIHYYHHRHHPFFWWFSRTRGHSGANGRWHGGECGPDRRTEAQPNTVRALIVAGMAAGFAGLFGTPWAAIIFSLEISRLGRFRLNCLLPSVACAWLSYEICHLWGATHAAYPRIMDAQNKMPEVSLFSLSSWGWAMALGLACALVARFYLLLHDGVQWSLKKISPQVLWRPAIAGLVIVALVLITGERSYLGLGVTAEDPSYVTITGSFQTDGAEHSSWLWKTIFTAITLGGGFKGGEVTPSFLSARALAIV